MGDDVTSARGLTLLGVDLRDAKEEIFVRMVCDGLAIGVAFQRAGFTSKTKDAPYNLLAVCHAFRSELARYLRQGVRQAS